MPSQDWTIDEQDQFIAQAIEREPAIGQRWRLTERDERLRDASQLLRLWQRRPDRFVGEQRVGHVPQHREAMATRAVELAQAVTVTHGISFQFLV